MTYSAKVALIVIISIVAVLALRAIYRNRKVARRNAALSLAQFDVAGQVADQNHFVEICHYFLFLPFFLRSVHRICICISALFKSASCLRLA